MNGILGDLSICICYIDNTLVYSSAKEERLRHLSEVLGSLQQNDLVVRYKCVFSATKVDFLGHHLSPEDISHLPDKMTTIQGFLPHAHHRHGPPKIRGNDQLLPSLLDFHHGTSIRITGRPTRDLTYSPSLPCGIVARIRGCHPRDQGLIPGTGGYFREAMA